MTTNQKSKNQKPKLTRTSEDEMTKIREIIDAKRHAGPEAYLWLQACAGDCILWPNEAASVNDNGQHAIERWQLSPTEEDALIETGELDEIN